MTYMVGEWSEEELKKMFTFGPEEYVSTDHDILYSGELIDVEKGGIKKYEMIPLSQNNITPVSDLCISNNIKNKLSKNKPAQLNLASIKVTDKNHRSIINELTGKEYNEPSKDFTKQEIKVI